MSFVHIPSTEIIRLFLNLRHNRPFMRISRILMLSLVVISAVSYAGEWVKAFGPNSPPCVIGKWECYYGPPLTLSELVFQLGGSIRLFVLPVIDLLAALLLLFKPSRTYLALLLLSFISIFIHFSAQPDPYMYFKMGSGNSLHLFSNAVIFLLSFPLALDEQAKLDPNWDADTPLWFI